MVYYIRFYELIPDYSKTQFHNLVVEPKTKLVLKEFQLA
jgi:hypothetical protein